MNTDHILIADYKLTKATLHYGSSSSSATITSGAYTPGSPLVLFASHTAGTSLSESTSMANYGTHYLYYVRIYNSNGDLIHWYVPVKDTAVTGVKQYGLWDRIDGTFSANLGAEAFEAGDETTFPSLDPVELTVADGASANLDEALADYNAKHVGESGFTDVTTATLMSGKDICRKLVKQGGGCLYLTNAIATATSGFQGTIDIQEGKVYNDIKYGLGMENNDASPTIVRSGAVLWIAVNEVKTSLNANRTFRIAGDGPDGNGAIYLYRAKSFTEFGIANAVGKMVYLDADATIGGYEWFNMNGLTLNDHTLQLFGRIQDTSKGFQTISGDGNIIVSNTAFRTFNNVEFRDATKACRMLIKQSGQTRFWSQPYSGDSIQKWTFEYANSISGSVSIHGDSGIGARNETYNTFTMPVVLTENTELSAQGQSYSVFGRLSFRGPVSSPAAFTTISKASTMWLHLYNSANDFKGGIAFDLGIIWPYVNGAIPYGDDAGPVTLNRKHATYTTHGFAYDGIEFPAVAPYDLPASWHFETRLNCKSRLTIDGTNVLDAAASQSATNAITVGPGPHTFAWRASGNCTPASGQVLYIPGADCLWSRRGCQADGRVRDRSRRAEELCDRDRAVDHLDWSAAHS